MDVRDKVAELYPFNGSDPGLIIALRSAFRAGVDWYAEGIDDGTAHPPRSREWEYDVSIVLSDTKPKARKDHRCSCCLGVIRKGVTYSRTTCIYDGRLYDWLSCPGCDDIASAVFNWIAYVDEGVTADDYDEWARDHQDDTVHGQGARAYLARRREASESTES